LLPFRPQRASKAVRPSVHEVVAERAAAQQRRVRAARVEAVEAVAVDEARRMPFQPVLRRGSPTVSLI
jgi:hypothetical protein